MRTALFAVLLSLILAFAALAEEHGSGDPIRTGTPSKGAKKIRTLKYPPLSWQIPEVGKEVSRVVLDNGMIAYLMEDRELPLVDLTVIFRTGIAAERRDHHGVADLTASLLRTGGTKSRTPDQVNEELEFMGADLSSYATAESARISLNLHERDFARGLDIVMDILQNPAFDQEKIDFAKSQLRERILRKNDRPAEVASREFFKTVFGDHPYGWSSDLQWPVVKSLTRDDLVRWYEKWYAPRRAFVAVSGAFKAEEMKALLNKTLGAWKKVDPPEMEIATPAPIETGKAYFIQRDLNQSIIYMGHLGVDRHSPDRYAVAVMNFILGGGSFNSRMMSKVRSDEGLAYTVYSRFNTDMARGGIFWAFCQTKAETTYKALDLMRKEIVRMRERPVTEAELAFAKDSLANSFIFTFEDSSSIVQNLAFLEYDGLAPDFYKTYLQKINAVTIADVQRVARQYLHPEAMALLILGDRNRLGDQLKPLGEMKEITIEELKD
jgi:predicted Zn-dependent peptidase